MLENVLYSNNGGNNNSANDNFASRDNIRTFSNVNRNGNHRAKFNTLEKRDNSISSSDHGEQNLMVNYEFTRIEPVNAETAVIVTSYIASSKGLHKNLASEERSFNVSIFLPNAAMECDFIWTLNNCETITLNLISSFQMADFVIHNFLTEQVKRAHLLLTVKKLTFENISFAVCQPWEEILLLKKPESAFIWDNEFCRMQKAQVEFFIKNSSQNDCNDDKLIEDDRANLLIQEEKINSSGKGTSEHKENMVRYKNERKDESGITVIPQENK